MSFRLPLSASLISATLLVAATAARADDPPQGTLVLVSTDEVFIPNGFDDNDESLVVLDGYMPNSCYKMAGTEVQRDPTTGAVRVLQYARRFPSICLQVRIPYFSEVSLGTMPMGNFKVSALGAAQKTLTVTEATNAGPDDFLYAPVDSARIEKNDATGRYSAVLQGRFTNTCMGWKDVAVKDDGRTVVVLPVIEMADRDDCADTEVPYSWSADLPEGLTTGRHLLHVRSLNGKSVNAMFTVDQPGQ